MLHIHHYTVPQRKYTAKGYASNHKQKDVGLVSQKYNGFLCLADGFYRQAYYTYKLVYTYYRLVISLVYSIFKILVKEGE